MNVSFDKIKKFIKNNEKSVIKYFVPILIVIVLFVIAIVKNVAEKPITADPNPVKETNHSVEEVVDGNYIYVDISGEINCPGVYKLKEGQRLFELIDLAGGLKPDADIDSINRAEEVYDGEKVIIPLMGGGVNAVSNGKVSINRASVEEFSTIPGIGASKAQRIIDYRNKNGKFKTLEDLKNVSGIGDATFENIKDYLTL